MSCYFFFPFFAMIWFFFISKLKSIKKLDKSIKV
jgi:hypothetical protein